MKSADLWTQYVHYTRDFTEHGRNMGFAAGGICWLLRDGLFVFPKMIYVALGSLALYFILDILHSMVGAIVLKRFIEAKEEELWKKSGSIEGDFEKPREVDRPAFGLWCFKAVALGFSFACIGFELVFRIL